MNRFFPVLFGALLLALSGCVSLPDSGYNIDAEIPQKYRDMLPAEEVIDREVALLLTQREIVTSTGKKVERNFYKVGAPETCGTGGGLDIVACHRIYSWAPAGSLDVPEQYHALYVPHPDYRGEAYARRILRHELIHVYVGNFHEG